MQSQKGFDNDLPPVRLSEKQRDHLVKDFQELERVTLRSVQTESEEEVPTSERPTMKPGSGKGMISPLLAFNRSLLSPSKERHVRQAPQIAKDNKSFWSSGVENQVKSPVVYQKKTKQNLNG